MAEQELVKKEQTEVCEVKSQSPAELIAAALQKDTDLDKLEKLLVLQERWESLEAKKAYHKAMAAFKSDPPKIEKDVTVSFSTSKGQTKYNHASLANVVDKISKALSDNGLSASWTTKQNGNVIVTCKITHYMGHSEETSLSAPADTSGVKNPIQAIASTISYLCRYSLLCLTGLATSEMDTDGRVEEKEQGLTEEEKNNLQDWMLQSADSKGIKVAEVEQKVLGLLKIDSFDKMTKPDYNRAVSALKTGMNK